MSINALTQVTKVYARPITGVVAPFPGGIAKWPTADRQVGNWCDLQSVRYRACFKLGGDLKVTAANLKWHVEQYFDEVEEKFGAVEANKMYMDEDNWDPEVMPHQPTHCSVVCCLLLLSLLGLSPLCL